MVKINKHFFFLYGVQSVLKFVNEVFQISSLEQDVNYPKYYKKVFRIYSVPI